MLRKVKLYFFGMKCHTDFFFSLSTFFFPLQRKDGRKFRAWRPLEEI